MVFLLLFCINVCCSCWCLCWFCRCLMVDSIGCLFVFSVMKFMKLKICGLDSLCSLVFMKLLFRVMWMCGLWFLMVCVMCRVV